VNDGVGRRVEGDESICPIAESELHPTAIVLRIGNCNTIRATELGSTSCGSGSIMMTVPYMMEVRSDRAAWVVRAVLGPHLLNRFCQDEELYGPTTPALQLAAPAQYGEVFLRETELRKQGETVSHAWIVLYNSSLECLLRVTAPVRRMSVW